MAMMDYYALLGVDPACDFLQLKRAYYREAKQHHPDHHGGHPAKTEHFKQLVEAFNVLSDPLTRLTYDARRPAGSSAPTPTASSQAYWEQVDAILDTRADDILEEMIVGNTIPRQTSLQTLMLDLERTDRFCLFREAKTRFYQGHHAQAQMLFERYLGLAPLNILGHYFLGRCHLRRQSYRGAARAYQAAIRLGAQRRPPLYVPRIRRELAMLRQHHLGWPHRVRAWLSGPGPINDSLTPDEQMRRELNRAMHRLIQDQEQAARKRLT